MREIKFRARKDNRWFYMEFVDGGLQWSKELIKFMSDEETVARFDVLEQYTGLKDKDGREIYEGDILTPYAYRNSSFGFNALVIFRKGVFEFQKNGHLHQEDFHPLFRSLALGEISNNQFIIIGNIHENPELLKPPVEEAHGGGKPNA
jgi:uncharacterized phage protein (TIGR01671 family)